MAITFYIHFCRLIGNKLNQHDMEVSNIYSTWYESIKTREKQIDLLNSMNKNRERRMAKYDSFFYSILNNLKITSDSQTDAFEYWITRGNLLHLEKDVIKYPNVTLTCAYSMVNYGKSLAAIN